MVHPVMERRRLVRIGKHKSNLGTACACMHMYIPCSTCGLAEELADGGDVKRSKPATSSCGNVSLRL